jgi:hypothetical protein
MLWTNPSGRRSSRIGCSGSCLHILDGGANYERIPPQLWHKFTVVTAVEGDGDLGPFKVLGGDG